MKMLKPVPLKDGAKVETVAEFLARGGKIKKYPEGKAEGIWTSSNIMTRPPKNERPAGEPIKRKPKSERTAPLTGEL